MSGEISVVRQRTDDAPCIASAFSVTLLGRMIAKWWPAGPGAVVDVGTTYLLVVMAVVACGCKSREGSRSTSATESAAASARATPPAERVHEPERIAAMQENARGLQLDGKYAYWQCEHLDTETGSIRRMPIAGGAIEEVAGNQKGLVAFSVSDGAAYWSVDYDGHSEIRSTSVGASTAPKKIIVRKAGATGLYAFGGNLYWTEFGSLFRIPVTGGTAIRLHERVAGPGGVANVLVGDRDQIFWSLDNDILTQHGDGSGFHVLASGFAQVQGMALDRDAVYVADAGDGTTGAVARVERATGKKTFLLERASRPWSVAVSREQAFIVSNAARGMLIRIATDGSDVVPVARGLTYGTSVALNESSVFWSTAEPGAIWREAR